LRSRTACCRDQMGAQGLAHGSGSRACRDPRGRCRRGCTGAGRRDGKASVAAGAAGDGHCSGPASGRRRARAARPTCAGSRRGRPASFRDSCSRFEGWAPRRTRIRSSSRRRLRRSEWAPAAWMAIEMRACWWSVAERRDDGMGRKRWNAIRLRSLLARHGGCGPESGSNGKRWRLDSAQEKVETQSQVQGLSLPSGAVAAVWAGQGSVCFAAWATGSEWEVSKRRWSDGCREMEPIPGDLGPRALSLRFTGVLAGPLQPSNDGWSRTERHKWAPGTSRRGLGNLARNVAILV
jgi:hypothetical protein